LIPATTRQERVHCPAKGASDRLGDFVPTAKKTATLGRRNPRRLKVHSLSPDFPLAREPQLLAQVRVAATSPSADNLDASLPDCSHPSVFDLASSEVFMRPGRAPAYLFGWDRRVLVTSKSCFPAADDLESVSTPAVLGYRGANEFFLSLIHI